jgi:hypothetical protein
MDQIAQYHKLCSIKPKYFNLKVPYDKPSIKKSKLNIYENDLIGQSNLSNFSNPTQYHQ